jgi:aerobic-type carbon monoxide dehydrogenase small subunit (CoxS/CutS family)
MADKDPGLSTSTNVSRRDLIKCVIAAGAVSSASYLFRVPSVLAQASAPGAVERLITLNVNTVLIDEVAYYSCSVFTHTVRDKKIVTIEGLASADGKLHPVQQGVVDEQGFQCAFCMPGFVMAAVGFLKTNPNPTRAELAHGISGNLCRCQDYDKILTALMRGAEHLRKA